MSKISTLKLLWKKNKYGIFVAVYNHIAHSGLLNNLSDKYYLKLTYRVMMRKKLNLNDPRTFNEKLQWLKLYDHRPEYIRLVDKYAVRDYVAQRIGSEYLIPLLGIWDTADDIDFEKLPNQFVLKCTHDSGSVLVCKDKLKFDINIAKEKLSKNLKRNLYYWGREWPYKDVKPRIIAEKYLADSSGADLKDYKFMMFNGRHKNTFICSHRFSENGLHVTFFDKNWNVMPFERHYPSVKEGFPKPKNYTLMISLAEILSRNIPFARIDFYEIGGKVYFGEITLYPGNGMEEFMPEEWDYTLGSWLKLLEKKI